MTPPNKKILNFRGKQIELKELDSGDWIDEHGTIYPAMLFDEGDCGIAPIETGNWDPFHINACKPHDAAFNRMKAGYADSTKGNLGVFTDFTKEVIQTMAAGAFAVTMGVPYIVVGGVGGMLRWAWLNRDQS